MNGSIRQRSSGTWELTLDVGRDLSGKRRRKYVTVRGSKRYAQRRPRELLSTLDQGMGLPMGWVTPREWLDRWMAEVVTPRRRQGTKERYAEVIERHIVQRGGSVYFGGFSPNAVPTNRRKSTEPT